MQIELCAPFTTLIFSEKLPFPWALWWKPSVWWIRSAGDQGAEWPLPAFGYILRVSLEASGPGGIKVASENGVGVCNMLFAYPV